jgi:hypothetical protein
MSAVKAGDVVRIVNVIGADKRENLFGHVLTARTAAEGDEPILSVAYMTPRHNPAHLGSANWAQAFVRQAGVPHASHPEVAAGQHSVYWIDTLPNEWPDGDEHPQLAIPGPSAVYSREHSEEFFNQKARFVPPKVEAVTVDHTVDENKSAENSSSVLPDTGEEAKTE